MQISQSALGVDQLAEQQCAPVAEAGHPAAELVAGIALGDRLGAGRHLGPHEQAQAVRTPQPARIEAQLGRERLVEDEQSGGWRGFRLPAHREFGQLTGESVAENDCAFRRNAHRVQPTARAGA